MSWPVRIDSERRDRRQTDEHKAHWKARHTARIKRRHRKTMAKDWRERLDNEIETLQQARDELRVQAHLGKAEAREVWEKMEKNWEHLEARLKRLGKITQESAEEVEDAAKLLLDEIKTGYKRVRDFL